MRIALVYDCLYPRTVGGAERWLRALAEDLRADHEVTYITRRQWKPEEGSPIEGVECVAVSPGGELYLGGRRRLLPPLLFALGVFRHLVTRRNRYDVVHCLSFPYLPLLAVRAALAGSRRTQVWCEWLECLSAAWWHAYGGPVGGKLGRWVQRMCVRLTPGAFAFSALVASRLEEEGFRGELRRLPGLWAGAGEASAPGEREPLVLAAGRHVKDKRMVVALEAFAIATRSRPDLRAVFVGDGPERPELLRRIGELGLQDAVSAPGFVTGEELAALRGRAACAVSASVRDGYGMAVLEAAAAGTPVVVCRAPDNGSVELVQPGVNGAVTGPSAEEIAAGLSEVLAAGPALRESTADWFRGVSDRVSVEASIAGVREAYSGGVPTPRR